MVTTTERMHYNDDESSKDVTLEKHEERSQAHYENLKKLIKEGNDMTHSDGVSLIGTNGFGNDSLGLVALLALLGNNGWGNNRNRCNDDCSNNSSTDINAILTTLGDIKASVPLAEAQVQLALAGSTAGLNSSINGANITNLQGQYALNQSLTAQSIALNESVRNVGDQVDSNLYKLNVAITNDGDKTRALIQSIDKQNDSRLITSQANEIAELRAEHHRANDRHGIEISMVNNQNQNQLQFQQQQQLLNTLTNTLCEVGQMARATNQSLIIGNTGHVSGGRQTANPTNVRA